MLVLAGETDAAARAQAIYDLEKQIATVHWDKNDSSDATKVYNKMTIAELTQAAPGFDWTGFIRGVGVGDDSILVAQPSAFRSEEHTSELQSLMRISYAVFCLKKKKHKNTQLQTTR